MIFNPNIGGQQMVNGTLNVSSSQVEAVVVYDDGLGGARLVDPEGVSVKVRKNTILMIAQTDIATGAILFRPSGGAKEISDWKIRDGAYIQFYRITDDFSFS